MSDAAGGYRSPYTAYPGASMPPPSTTPEQGKADLWTFFWLAIANTAIIAAAGIGAWWFVH
ncbi:MAG TPA: hypothetical protein VMG81_05690 [Thermoplasmata archaeon]|nr:hypothetical protein [Thermoplasmata archaeon]